VTISERTGFALSLVIGLCGIVGSGMWWASSIEAKTSAGAAKLAEVEQAFRDLRDAQQDTKKIVAVTAAQVSMIVDFLGADQMGPPKSLRPKRRQPPQDFDQ
jgi:hypothetical protein